MWCLVLFVRLCVLNPYDCGMSGSPKQFVFRSRHRIRQSGEFSAVFDARCRKTRGVVTVFLLPTDRSEHRLGLSIGKRVGNAVVRGRFKRMMREAFRHEFGRLPSPSGGGGSIGAYDIVVNTRKHDALRLDEYTKMFVEAVEAGHRTHEKRAAKAAES